MINSNRFPQIFNNKEKKKGNQATPSLYAEWNIDAERDIRKHEAKINPKVREHARNIYGISQKKEGI